MKWDDLNSEKRFVPWIAYSQTKLANILHAKELAHRLENTGISVYVLHPGEFKLEKYPIKIEIFQNMINLTIEV
jgi:NAD(P)-dependent dehydrogenase (short-subunit alcohol dehydrogenase family)